ncbi:MAG: hypothetical protein K9M08_01190 [Pirellula sp.]|nr:hypothetical protein [Pirellula sp.]
MSFIAIALLLFLAAMVIFAIDLMIPSGGVLIGVTACLAFAAVVFAFRHSTSSGIWMLIASMGSIPIMMWLFVEVWPLTPLGRQMISKPEPSGSYVWSDAAKSVNAGSLIGAEGTVLNEMIPSGLVQIGDQTFEAFSESGPIDAGKAVRIVRLDVGRLVVAVIREKNPMDAPMSHGTGLDRPISDLDLESID